MSPTRLRVLRHLPLEAVEQELFAVATYWAEAIVANDAARIATLVTED